MRRLKAITSRALRAVAGAVADTDTYVLGGLGTLSGALAWGVAPWVGLATFGAGLLALGVWLSSPAPARDEE